MDRVEQQPEPAAAAMQDVLRAEVVAREAVEKARLEAAQCVKEAQRRAQALEEAAEHRIRSINSSTGKACAAIERQLQAERDRRLARLEDRWTVDLDPELLKQTVQTFAQRLFDEPPGPDRSGRGES